jgi:hypothetical protein
MVRGPPKPRAGKVNVRDTERRTRVSSTSNVSTILLSHRPWFRTKANRTSSCGSETISDLCCLDWIGGTGGVDDMAHLTEESTEPRLDRRYFFSRVVKTRKVFVVVCGLRLQ